jgi:hypothetical protein
MQIGTDLDKTVKSIEQKRIRDTDQGGTGLDHYDDNSKVMIVEIQWCEKEVFYLIADEQTNQKLQINQAQYDHMLANAKKIEERLGHGIQVMPTAARMTRRSTSGRSSATSCCRPAVMKSFGLLLTTKHCNEP